MQFAPSKSLVSIISPASRSHNKLPPSNTHEMITSSSQEIAAHNEALVAAKKEKHLQKILREKAERDSFVNAYNNRKVAA